MASCEFEEKEYELAAVVELGRRGDVYGPGQVLEGILGYDATAAPAESHPIWRILDVPRPRGLRLLPMHWEPGQTPSGMSLPSSPVSLIFQWKRPDYLYGASARQWRLWGQPFFRFTRTKRQQTILLRLERSLGAEALVRYGAPAFWRRGELEAAQMEHSVLARSGFVGPGEIGAHSVWTYIRPGTDGLSNPHGRPTRFETLDDLMASWAARDSEIHRQVLARREPDIEAHLERVGAAAVQRNPSLRTAVNAWRTELVTRDLGLRPEQVQALGNLAAIVTLTHNMGASWHVIDVDMPRA